MKPNKQLLIILVVTCICIMLALGWLIKSQNNASNKSGGSDSQTPCTLEAKICPDGSSVGRGGKDCQFSPCPNEAPSVKQ